MNLWRFSMKFKSELSQTIYETAEGMYHAGVMRKQEFEEIAQDCVVQKSIKPLTANSQVLEKSQFEAAL